MERNTEKNLPKMRKGNVGLYTIDPSEIGIHRNVIMSNQKFLLFKNSREITIIMLHGPNFLSLSFSLQNIDATQIRPHSHTNFIYQHKKRNRNTVYDIHNIHDMRRT